MSKAQKTQRHFKVGKIYKHKGYTGVSYVKVKTIAGYGCVARYGGVTNFVEYQEEDRLDRLMLLWMSDLELADAEKIVFVD